MKMQAISIQRHTGFTLIEIMIVIVILGIIAMIAIPSYQNTVRKSRRTEAKTSLSLGVQQMERCFTEVSDYSNAICPDANSLAALGEGYYTFTVTTTGTPATAYTLLAAATSKGNQDEDTDCGQFEVDSTGLKKSYNTSTGSAVANAANTCW